MSDIPQAVDRGLKQYDRALPYIQTPEHPDLLNNANIPEQLNASVPQTFDLLERVATDTEVLLRDRVSATERNEACVALGDTVDIVITALTRDLANTIAFVEGESPDSLNDLYGFDNQVGLDEDGGYQWDVIVMQYAAENFVTPNTEVALDADPVGFAEEGKMMDARALDVMYREVESQIWDDTIGMHKQSGADGRRTLPGEQRALYSAIRRDGGEWAQLRAIKQRRFVATKLLQAYEQGVAELPVPSVDSDVDDNQDYIGHLRNLHALASYVQIQNLREAQVQGQVAVVSEAIASRAQVSATIAAESLKGVARIKALAEGRIGKQRSYDLVCMPDGRYIRVFEGQQAPPDSQLVLSADGLQADLANQANLLPFLKYATLHPEEAAYDLAQARSRIANEHRVQDDKGQGGSGSVAEPRQSSGGGILPGGATPAGRATTTQPSNQLGGSDIGKGPTKPTMRSAASSAGTFYGDAKSVRSASGVTHTASKRY